MAAVPGAGIGGGGGGIPEVGAVIGNIGFFNAANVRTLTGSIQIKTILHVSGIVASGNPRLDIACISVMANAVAQVKKDVMRILLDDDDFYSYMASEFIGAVLTNPVADHNHLPALFKEEVQRQIEVSLNAGAMYNATGALRAHGTAGHYTAMAAIAHPAAAACAVTWNQTATVVRTVLAATPALLNRATSAATSAFMTLGRSLAKRGQCTRDYLRKRLPALRGEFDDQDFDYSIRVLHAVWSRYLCDISHADAPNVFASLAGYAPANCVVFREVLCQAQFSGFTTVIFIVNSMRLYPDFPWNGLVAAGQILVNEWTAAQQDIQMLQGDAYAAFGQAKPQGNQKYPHLIYLSTQLLIQVGNYRSIREYGGLNVPLPNKAICDTWITGFVNARALAAPVYPTPGPPFVIPVAVANIPTHLLTPL